VGGVNGGRQRALELIVFCDGLDDAGQFPDLARRARAVARDLLETLDMLEAERSARRAMQERCEAQQAILGERVYDAVDGRP
jgi:hypothetical protein